MRYKYAGLITYTLATSHELDVDELKSYEEAIENT